ncbi:hypothetical protein VTN77DRAFT_9748 [Rasamsonia byssochlamydoides]|uniref:uncharacterized protein n=1 Tax=Rasamsonia byssochlamydoides TaxID=89139 RepID=UPI0037423F18
MSKGDFTGSCGNLVSNTIKTVEKDFKDAFDPSKTIQPSDRFPDFKLPDATGKEVTRDVLLANGPILISFYRGEWCPYCNLELQALQRHLPEFRQKGVSLVAISPELPDQSLSMAEKNGLEFTVLSDVGNRLSRQLGILFAQPDAMRSVLGRLQVPIPATILVDKQGTVRNTFIDPSWQKRLEPATALKWIDEL